MPSSAADERGDSPDGRNQTEGSNDQASTDGRAFQVRFVASLLGWSHHCEQVASKHGSAKREYEPSKQLVTEDHRCPVNQLASPVCPGFWARGVRPRSSFERQGSGPLTVSLASKEQSFRFVGAALDREFQRGLCGIEAIDSGQNTDRAVWKYT